MEKEIKHEKIPPVKQEEVADDTTSIVSGNQSMNLLIGEAAKHSFAASQVLNREKPPAIHDPLLMTAIGLLAEQNTDLNIGVGLPLAYYSSQKEGLQSRLNKLSAYVNVNNHEYYIKNPAVQVLPQGAGILFKAGAKLPPNSYVGVIDPGTYTTEYLLFEIKGGQPIPILEACGSVEAGIHLVYAQWQGIFRLRQAARYRLEWRMK